MKNILIILILLLNHVAFSQQILNINIDQIRGQDTTQGGCSDYDSSYVRTYGVIYGNNFRQSSNGMQISLVETRSDTLLNSRCGIGLFKGTWSFPVTLNEGDSVMVVGLVNCFNGLSQIIVDSIKVLKTGAVVKSPRTVVDLDEVSESYLVKLLNMEFISSSWPASPPPAGFTAKAFMGTLGTTDYKEIDIRIDNDCDLYGQQMPQGKVDIVGIGGQFDTSPPRNSRYQLLPRRSTDITSAAPVELPQISFQDTSYTLTEGSAYFVPVVSSQNVSAQISCLVVSQDITTNSQDYSLQLPSVATFPLGVSESGIGFTTNTDSENESDEQFYLKLRKISDNYTIGADSTIKITILGTTSVKNIRYFDFYKNSYNGTLSVKLPDDFKGTVSVFNSMGVLVLTSEDDMINQDLSTLNKKPLGIYRAVFTTQQNRFVKNFIN